MPASAKPSLHDLEPLLRQAVETLDQLARMVAEPAGLPSDAVGIAEAVSTARSELYRELIRQGWLPPDAVPQGLELDDRLRSQGLGSGYDHSADPD